MFINLPPQVEHADPWRDISFEDRLAALQRGRLRVAYYYDYPDASTFRYRVHNMIDVLRAREGDSRPEISASWFCLADGDLLERVAEAADTLVVCRARYSDRINRFITRARNLGRDVVFDVDDLVVDPNFAHLVAYTLDEDLSQDATWDHWFGYIGRIATTMRMCDRVITTNAFLAARIADCSGKPVAIVPNFINAAQIALSDRVFAAKQDGGFARDERLHLGYFSGSPSHNRDFEIVSGALARLMDEDDRLHLRVVGYLEVKGPVTRHADRIERYPMQDYVNLQHLIGSTELNLAPLQNNVFTNCKSELKYFEAAIVGTATIASPTYVFTRAIRGGNGWLAGAQEWDERIRLAIASLDDDRGRGYADIAARARDHALRLFSWDAQHAAIRAALLGGEAEPAAGVQAPSGPSDLESAPEPATAS